jgi:hypothetical protein
MLKGGVMQTRLRKEIDGDLNENLVGVTDYKTEQNRFEISCSSCFKTFYADEQIYESIKRSLEQALDNPFLCDDCRQEYEEMAYGER